MRVGVQRQQTLLVTIELVIWRYSNEFIFTNQSELDFRIALVCFRLSFRPSSEAEALTPYLGDLNHCRNCTLASEDGLKESPKHVR
jgi:hypothetical protein